MLTNAKVLNGIVQSIVNDNDFGWILLTGSNNNTVRQIASIAVQQSTLDNPHIEECSILTPARRGETWTDIVIETVFRNAVKHATPYTSISTGKTSRVAIVYLWQLTDFFVSKRKSENWTNHICVQDSERTARKITQCYSQLKRVQKQHGVRVVVVATATIRNPTIDASSLLPTKVRSCFRYHIPIASGSSSTRTEATKRATLSPPTSSIQAVVAMPMDTSSTLDWGSVVGMESVKQSLLESIVWSRTKANDFHRLGVRPSKGILLYGPPGTGKTLVARTVAAKANVYFLSMSFADVVRSGVGESEAAIALAFASARRHAPSVLFIDEIQALFSERKTAGQVAKKMISQLLQEMDGLTATTSTTSTTLQHGKEDNRRSNNHVVVLAATNLPQCLDPALLRPGRFDKLIHVGLPTATDRETMFRNLLRRRGQQHETIEQETELCRYVGEMGKNLTGAEIENVYRIVIGSGGGGDNDSSDDDDKDDTSTHEWVNKKSGLNKTDIARAIEIVRTTRHTATGN
jgi:SpoVK/Ycf46/Vps4 family AAA+-type ATPase